MKYLILLISLSLHAIPHNHKVGEPKNSPKYDLIGVCEDFEYVYLSSNDLSIPLRDYFISKAVSFCFNQPKKYCLKFLAHDPTGRMNIECGIL